MTTRERLKFGLAADVVIEDTDRLIYVPPPVPRGEHADTCGCKECVMHRWARKPT